MTSSLGFYNDVNCLKNPNSNSIKFRTRLTQSMGTDEESLILSRVVNSLDLLRDKTVLQSAALKIKALQDVCNTLTNSIKESKPRTEEFRTLCRFVVRLSYLSPIKTIRDLASSLLKEHRHIFRIHEEVSPSRFEGESFLNPVNFSDAAILRASPRLTHLDWVLSSQGQFLELHQKTNEVIMESDGPLPRPWRHYIAMLGASCYSCEYLVRNQMELFLLTGGDLAWLRDPKGSVPRKIQCLSTVNRVMAHKPWALESSHVEAVVVNGRWSSAELVHALIILATFHSLPSLVFGSGTKIEDDLTTNDESCSCGTDSSSDALVESEPKWVETAPLPKCFSLNDAAPSLLQRLLQQGASSSGKAISSNPVSLSQRSISSVGEEPISAFEGFGSLNDNPQSGVASPVSAAPQVATAAKQPTAVSRMSSRMGEEEKGELTALMAAQPKWRSPISRIVLGEPPEVMEYKDFMQKADTILHTLSFSWEDHGMMVLSRQMPEATDCINEEHLHSLEFTTNTIGDRAIESTTTVREAIVKYVQRMYGVFHDDYRYDGLNKILPVIHKAYLKKLACYPERLTRVDFLRMRKFEGFSAKDLIHYAHLVSQTKRIVELTWTMKALMSYQAGGTS